MSLQMNQFQMTPLKGALALLMNPSTITCQIDPASVATTIKPGSYLKLVATADGALPIVDLAAATDVAFGVVLYTPKTETFEAGDQVEVAFTGSIVWMESSEAIDRGEQLEFVPTGNKVKGNTGNPVCGIALDEFAGNTSLGRVLVLNPYTIPATITGGSINDTPIGGSTPSTGAFTTLTATGVITLSGVIAGATPLVFEGATADAYETSLAITDPTADRTVTIPDATGSFALNGAAVVITSGPTPSWTPGAAGSLSTLTPGEAMTIAAVTTGAQTGKLYTIQVLTSGTTPYTITFGSNFKTTGTLSSGSSDGKYFNIVFMFNGTTFVEVSRTAAM